MKDRSFAQAVAQGLRQRERHHFRMEEYGSDGEILEVWERDPMDSREEGLLPVVFCPEGVEPRRDWRARGIVPPRGYHRWEGME